MFQEKFVEHEVFTSVSLRSLKASSAVVVNLPKVCSPLRQQLNAVSLASAAEEHQRGDALATVFFMSLWLIAPLRGIVAYSP